MDHLYPPSPKDRFPTAKWSRDDEKTHTSHLQNTR